MLFSSPLYFFLDCEYFPLLLVCDYISLHLVCEYVPSHFNFSLLFTALCTQVLMSDSKCSMYGKELECQLRRVSTVILMLPSGCHC